LTNRTSLTAPTRPPPGVNADTSTLTTVATSAAIAASNNLSDTVGRPTASTTRTAIAKTSNAPRGSTIAAVTVAPPSGNTGCITRENSTRKVARLTIVASSASATSARPPSRPSANRPTASSVSAHTDSQIVGQSSGTPRCPAGVPTRMDTTAPAAAPATISHHPVATAGRRHHTPAPNATTPATASASRTIAVRTAGADTPTSAKPVASAR